MEASTIYNNLAMCVWAYEGPAASLEIWRDGISFSERRGLEPLISSSSTVNSLFSLGRWDELVRTADEVFEWSRTHGTGYLAVVAGFRKAHVLALRGAGVLLQSVRIIHGASALRLL